MLPLHGKRVVTRLSKMPKQEVHLLHKLMPVFKATPPNIRRRVLPANPRAEAALPRRADVRPRARRWNVCVCDCLQHHQDVKNW